jgi:tricorn protease
MPAEGGVPRRLTWHPAPDTVTGWTPDSKRVVFSSGRNAFSRYAELYTVSLDGGLEERLPLPMGYEASYSPDGERLAYVPLRRAFQAWKRYRGGGATPIWIADLKSSQITKLPREGSNDFCPAWVGEKVYFLSDRLGRVTLFSYDLKTEKVTQAVPPPAMDFKSASAGPGAIVIEEFGRILLYDLKSKKLSPVPISISADLLEVRPRLVNVGRRLSNAHISPTGARAVFEARGEIVTVPAEKGDARNITNTPGVMERAPGWSPDGKSIAYFSDESGEYELHVRDALGRQPARNIKLADKPTFYLSLLWSPDSKKIAYQDAHCQIWWLDVEKGVPVLVDKDLYQSRGRGLSWSPDSRWLVFTRSLPSHMRAVMLYALETAKTTQLTDGMSDASNGVFDKDGKYLYFTASTDIGPALEVDLHAALSRPTRSVYLAVLSRAEASPFAPESDEEKVADKKADDKKADEKKADEKKPADKKPEEKKVAEVKIDFEKISQRILAMPLPPRRYVGLEVGKAGTLLALEAAPNSPGVTVHRYDLKQRKSDVVIAGVNFFELAANGEKMLVAQAGRWSIQALKPLLPTPAPPAPPAAAPPTTGALKTDGLEVRSDPRAEWADMFHDAWRIQREFFYDPNLHGVDPAVFAKKYEPYLAAVTSRRDLNYVFADMMGELTVGHLSVFGGDMPDVKSVPAGLLGCDYSVENGRYRFARIFDGENWNPDLKAPLTEPGVNVQTGEYLLAVNGRDLSAADNVYAFFEATAGKQTVLKVGPNPNGEKSRDVTVVPVASESRLRHLAWIEDNRRKVDQATGGRVAYVYMPDTSFGGLTSFNRYFYAQVDKEAAIIDERFNGGGMLATDIIERLQRKRMSAAATRDGADSVQPQGAIFGPKVMLINEFAGSGGDAMPNYFRRAGVGKLIGKRTWGGLVGMAGAPQLMDGGVVTAPASGIWGPDSHWDAENVGIPPDIEVDLEPAAVRAGKDPQLDKAIEVVLAELAAHPVAQPKRPAYPNYQKP